MSQFAFSCEPGWEDRLIGELQRVFPQSANAHVADGWVVSDLSGDDSVGTPCVALVRNVFRTRKRSRPSRFRHGDKPPAKD